MNQSTAPAPTPIATWRQQVMERSNDSPLDVRIQCPLCGNVATPRQFHEAGADPERAFVNCIGRVTGAKGGLNKGKRGATEQPCDWAAGGLFGTLGKGIELLKEDGTTTWVFDFADEAMDGQVTNERERDICEHGYSVSERCPACEAESF